MVDDVAPTTLINVGSAPDDTLLLFCIVSFVSLVVFSYICNFVVAVVPIPTFPDLFK